MEQEYTNIVTLTDEEGTEIDFEILDIVPLDEREYAVLLPIEDESDEAEAVILEILHAGSDDEEDMLQGVEDACIIDQVFTRFMEQNPELFSEATESEED